MQVDLIPFPIQIGTGHFCLIEILFEVFLHIFRICRIIHTEKEIIITVTPLIIIFLRIHLEVNDIADRRITGKVFKNTVDDRDYLSRCPAHQLFTDSRFITEQAISDAFGNHGRLRLLQSRFIAFHHIEMENTGKVGGNCRYRILKVLYLTAPFDTVKPVGSPRCHKGSCFDMRRRFCKSPRQRTTHNGYLFSLILHIHPIDRF